MKRVVIVRHAKAVPYGYDDDFERDLEHRGFLDAQKLSRHILKNEKGPELIISSPARRALKTAKIFALSFAYPEQDIKIEPSLYDGVTTSEFISMLHDVADSVETVFVFGHNPTMHYLAVNLAQSFMGDMPTCSTVAIDMPAGSWSEVAARTGQVAFHLMPRMFK